MPDQRCLLAHAGSSPGAPDADHLFAAPTSRFGPSRAEPLEVSASDLTFLAGILNLNDRLDMFWDGITAMCAPPRHSPESAVGVLLWRWQHTARIFEYAAWHTWELLEFLQMLAEYRKLRGGRRTLARRVLVAAVCALPSQRPDVATWLDRAEAA